MKTKSLRILLVLFLILCPYSLWAYDFEVDNIQYTIVSFDELTVEVSGLTDTNVNELIIPVVVEYNGRTLTIVSIANYAFRDGSSLTSITIPESVTSIGSYAFSGCSSLTSITIPESVTSIRSYAFYGCSSLTSITIPESVTSIGDYAFSGCTSLTSITIPESVTSLGSGTFYYCSSLTSVTIPESVTSLGSGTFESCSSLTSITIPESVTSLGSGTFESCSSLTSVTIPESVTSIGSYAFRYCSSLTSIDIPNSVTSIGSYAFQGCISLECFTISNGVEYSYEWFSKYEGYTYYPLLWTDAPAQMKKIIISDGSSPFGIRGYFYQSSNYAGPSFTNIDVEYLYVGRPLTDISSWEYNNKTFSLPSNLTQPLGTISTLEISGGCIDVPYFYQSIEKLILGEDVATYTILNIYQGELTEIMCKSATPPSLSGTFDNRTYIDVTLCVPTGCKEIYQATDGWKNFWDIQEMDVNDMIPSYVPIESVPNIQVKVEGYYTISGQKINSLQHGINIVRYSDGTTKKVLVK